MSFYVYIAAPFAARDGLRDFAQQLKRIGMECTSLWLLDESDIEAGQGAAPTRDADEIRKEALADLDHVNRADVIVQFTGNAIEALRIPNANGPMLHSGGRQVELGYALAKRKKAIVIGHPENIFQRTLATVVPDWHEAVLELVAMRTAHEAMRPAAVSA
jgi:nucleoside 2-deoxyribosyltransferase